MTGNRHVEFNNALDNELIQLLNKKDVNNLVVTPVSVPVYILSLYPQFKAGLCACV